MRQVLPLLAVVSLVGAVTLSCNGTTGDELLTFSAYASGPPGASQPFKAGNFTIQLTTARMHIGAIYFDEAPPGTGFDGPVCIASGVYAAQVPGPVSGQGSFPTDVDLLSSAPQEFTVYGNGSADTALSWQVWLTDDSVGVDAVNGPNFTPIVQLEGIATDADGRSASFGGVVTINAVNRSKGSSNPALPGAAPICKDRIVQIGGLDLTFFSGGTLDITVDPRIWFTQGGEPIDFSPGQLPFVTDPNCNPDSSVPLDPQDYGLAPETPPPSTQTCGGSGQPCCAVDAGVVVFGGTGNGSNALSDAWTFDGAWTPVSVSGPPPARFDAGITTLGSKLVLFGGSNAASGDRNDTWMFDGTSWAPVYVASAPSARERPGMAALGNQVVLFGGASGGSSSLNDTWVFDVSASSGTSAWASWTQESIANSPPVRAGATMATLGNRIVLFGGSGGGGAYLDDTWTFDGTSWTQASPTSSPPARYGASMAVVGSEAVLFGGFASGGGAVGDTWTFDGTNWTQVNVTNAPSPRGDASMAPFAGKIVLFGGRGSGGALNDTWTFDGTSWTQASVSSPPPVRYGASIALLPSAQTCLGALTCTNDVCGPTYCIPNSSLLSGADPGANAGFDLFTEITSGAPFSVSYTRQ
jgi:N-acetylneuraminic acid mutarotase